MTKGPNDFMNGNSGRLCSNNYLLRYSFYIYAKKKKKFTLKYLCHLEKETATHSCIPAWRNPVDRGAWWATVHVVAESQTRLKRLSMHAVMSLSFSYI